MTSDALCDSLIAEGWVEYTPPLDDVHRVRRFRGPRLSGPDCPVNDRAPSLHARIHRLEDLALPATPPCAAFEIQGGRSDGLWLKADLFSIPNELVVPTIPAALAAAQAVWTAFCLTVDQGSRS